MKKSKIAVLYQSIVDELENYGTDPILPNYALRGWTRIHNGLSRSVGDGVDSLLRLTRKHNNDYNIRGRENNTILYFMDFNKKPPPEINPAGAERREERD